MSCDVISSVSAMEEPRTNSQVPHPELLDDIRSCSNECSYEDSKQSNSFSMPICFLVREQAKSQVAIQDLQTRLSHVENVQVDVIDSLLQLRNYLCEVNSEFVTTPSCLNETDSPGSKFTTYHTASEPARTTLKSSSYSPKAQESAGDDFQRISSIVTIQNQPQKHFDSTKSKDSALESDKQDSGLDSDCREHNEIHPSIRPVPHWLNHESSDQLLQLLDEISVRSEYLQKQFAVTEDATLSDIKERMIPSPSGVQVETCSPPGKDSNCMEETCNPSEQSTSNKALRPVTLNDSHEKGVQVTIPPSKFNSSGFAGFLERKSFCDKGSARRVGKNIDSTMVSSILKETNSVDLQRQALIYLVDNAVLNTRLREMEQSIACKNLECDKVENSLKEEVRLLMMENRELRISLDEQKMENNIFKSRVAMLERVLQSMNVENQELNWQLGESLNLQQFSKKGFCNLSSSATPNSASSSVSSSRKSSSLPPQAGRNLTMNYSRSKLLPGSSFLNSTVEEPEDCASIQLLNPRTKSRTGPLQSSTPYTRTKGTVMDSPLSTGVPASFYSVKKCLKSGHSFDSGAVSFKTARSETYADCDIPESCVRKRPFPQTASQKHLTLATGSVSKFPFNSILEKLKANSEVRLTRNIPNAKDGGASASDHETDLNCGDSHVLPDQLSKHSKSPQGSGKSVGSTKKSGNIHQRIQNILDRIVAESEEAS